jgi:hypothetical protein
MSPKTRTVILLSIGVLPAWLGASAVVSSGILWVAPANLESRDLLHGRGGKANQPPAAQFTFVKEEDEGTNPKFVITDVKGVKWKVKLGQEAQPEVVASRLVWAAGYYVHEDYYLPELRVAKLPSNIHRGKRWISGSAMRNARLSRVLEDEKKVGTWEWRHSPFAGSREFNGLRVLMALLNNWDLKNSNTAIYEDGNGRRFYAVSDLGGTFGAPGVTFSKSEMKGNLEAYRKSKFIRSTTPEFVNFSAPARPQISGAVSPRNFVDRIQMQWIAKRIPREHARWMGQLLGRLSGSQIRDAFRAAHYTPEEVEGFALVLERRIAELKAL